jgi:hypothetical protein
MKSRCRSLQKGCLVGVTALVCACTAQITALADGSAAQDDYELKLIDEDQGTPLEDVDFSIYKVGELTDPETIELEPEYEDACVYLEMDDMDSWAADASTLDAYLLLRDYEGAHIVPEASGVTDEDGEIHFDDLEPGVYLITGSVCTVDKTIYTPSASLLLIGEESDETNEITTEVYVKNGSRPEVDESQTISLSAVKVWRDRENEEGVRPTSVSLVIFKDGVEYDQVELTEEGNWRYTWEGLSPNADWKLMEVNVPEEHTVTVEFDGSIFAVTNTKRASSKRLGDKASGEGVPENPGTTEETTQPQSNPGRGTGDSGMIWNLIPILGLAGIVLVLSGWGICRKAENNHDEE